MGRWEDLSVIGLCISFDNVANLMTRHRNDTQSYCFFVSSCLGGGKCLRLSGLGVVVPSPTCSQGDRDSKLLRREDW